MYRPPSVRNFKSFVGELTAEAASTYLSVLEIIANESSDENSYWEDIAKKHGVVLSGVKGENILRSQVRLSIVSIYSGFEIFVEEIINESKEYGFSWTQPDKVSPLAVLQKNFVRDPTNKTHLRQLFDCIDYYRYLRISIAHPSNLNKEKAESFYKAQRDSLDAIRRLYGTQTAPNAPLSISFHDVKFLCRILIDATEEIANCLEPNDKQYFASIPFDKWTKYGNNAEAKKRSAKTFLRTEYGILFDKANEIVDNNYGPFA